MPRTRSLVWSELKIGVLSIAAAIITAVTIVMLTGGKGFFWQRYSIKTRFTNVAGLNSGSPVRLAGLEVGEVTGVQLVGDQVDVILEVKESFRPQITTQSVATLGAVSLLGESAVDISPASGGTPIPEWGYVKAGPAPAALADITNDASRGIAELTGLLQDVRAGKGTVGKLMTDEELYRELNRFLTSANDLTTGIKQGRGSIGRLLNDPTTADALEASLKNVQELTRRLNAGEGSLGKLLNDDSFAKSLASATANMDTLVGKMNRGEGTAGKLMNDTALYDKLTSVSNQVELLVTRLNNGEGTAGQLLKDKQLYENMNKAVNDLTGLIADMKAFVDDFKKDPDKKLKVNIGLFNW